MGRGGMSFHSSAGLCAGLAIYTASMTDGSDYGGNGSTAGGGSAPVTAPLVWAPPRTRTLIKESTVQIN